jgi:hypothetical protein
MTANTTSEIQKRITTGKLTWTGPLLVLTSQVVGDYYRALFTQESIK